jgi:hypothetical protein
VKSGTEKIKLKQSFKNLEKSKSEGKGYILYMPGAKKIILEMRKITVLN